MKAQSRDIIIESFQNLAMKQLCHVPIVAVYQSPKEYPGKFVARLWDIHKKPKLYIMVKDTLAGIQENIPIHMVRLPPTPQDDPILIETWI